MTSQQQGWRDIASGWDSESIKQRALDLAISMAAVPCKNAYPKGVFGHEARAHYDEARHIAALATPCISSPRATGESDG